MRVLLVSQEFPPDTHWGGIGTYMGVIARALSRADAEVHVLSVVQGQPRTTERREDGVTVHRASLDRPRGVGKLLRLPQTWDRFSLARAVAREVERLEIDFDVIECAAWKAEGMMLAKRRVAPLAVHVFSTAREALETGARPSLDHRFAVQLEDVAIRKADLVLAPPAHMTRVAELLQLDPAACVEIDPPVEMALHEGPGASAGPPRILFTGRLEPRKAPETLIRALPTVRAQVPQAELTLAGQDSAQPGRPSYARWLSDLAEELGVTRAVHIRGRWADHRDVVDAIASASVCAVPSRAESFGYAAAEAAALGRPVVASNLPSLASIVEDGVSGRLASVDDPDAWAEALTDVLVDAERAAAMGRAGAERVTRLFDPDRIAVQTLKAYELAIERFRARRPGDRNDALAAAEHPVGRSTPTAS